MRKPGSFRVQALVKPTAAARQHRIGARVAHVVFMLFHPLSALCLHRHPGAHHAFHFGEIALLLKHDCLHALDHSVLLREVHIEHSDGSEFVECLAHRQTRRPLLELVLQGEAQAVGDDRDEDMRFDAPLLLMEDRADREGSLQLLERRLDLDELQIERPELRGVATTDGRELIFTRYTQPEPAQQLRLGQLGGRLPGQAPPRITAKNTPSI